MWTLNKIICQTSWLWEDKNSNERLRKLFEKRREEKENDLKWERERKDMISNETERER